MGGMLAQSYLWATGFNLELMNVDFNGWWAIFDQEPWIDNRPHYVTEPIPGVFVHLFHCISHFGYAQWVIGPVPGNEHGWLCVSSEANTPEGITEVWHIWTGTQWAACETFQFIPSGAVTVDVAEEDFSGWDAQAIVEEPELVPELESEPPLPLKVPLSNGGDIDDPEEEESSPDKGSMKKKGVFKNPIRSARSRRG